MTPVHLEVRVPRDSARLNEVREFLARLVRENPAAEFTGKELAEVQLGVHEACVNAIRHGEPENGDGDLRVVFRLRPDRLTVEVHDGGEGFDPDAVPVPRAEALREGGYGVFIMKNTMDRITTVRESGGFVVILTRFYRTAARGGAVG